MQEPVHRFSNDMIIQYSIVGFIILAAFAWMVWKLVRINKKNGVEGSCCGCSLADTCKKKYQKENSVTKTLNHGNDKDL